MDTGDTYRCCLPAKSTKSDLGIWSVLKSCVGKDLSKITMPIQFNEPLSFLQRLAESLEYSHLLDMDSSSEVERMEIVSAFAISNLASNWNRLGKPFNPLLGETYELQRNGIRFLCEQVSHHPPISAFHAESATFVFQGWIYPKLKLGAKSIEVHPKGNVRLYLKRYKETYTWGNVNCSVHNVIVGKLWIEHHGHMNIHCIESGLSLNLHFKAAGWFNSQLHRVEGFILDSNKQKVRFVYGKWTEALKSTDIESYEEFDSSSSDHKAKMLGESSSEPNCSLGKKSPSVSPKPGKKMFQKLNSLSLRSFSTSAEPKDELSPEAQDDQPRSEEEMIDIPNSRTLWEVRERPEFSADYYNFTSFTMTLNQILPNMVLCPTDSRLRPDIRKMEEGDLEGAGSEKQRLEDQQRKVLKSKVEINPRWFEKHGADWTFTGDYWNCSKSNITSIF